MMPNIRYKFMEKIYDINSDLSIYNYRVDTSDFCLDMSIKDLNKVEAITFTYLVLISIMYVKTQSTFYLIDYIVCILSYLLTFSIALIYKRALEQRVIHINKFKAFHKNLITFCINITSLANFIFLILSSRGDSLYIMRFLYFEFFYIFFLTVLLKIEDSAYIVLWFFNLMIIYLIEYTWPAKINNLNLEKLFCIILCICSILINQDSNKKPLKNYIIHKKTQRYIDHLITEMFCLFFAWNNNKFVYVNQIAKNFIYNKYENTNQDDTSDYENYDAISKSKKIYNTRLPFKY
jgi:hypothetical protein